MRTLRPLALIALSISMLMVPAGAPGQAGRNAGTAQQLAALRAGQWVQLDGMLQPDSTALCTEVRLLIGDFLDDDWALKGTIQAVDASRRQITIAGTRIQLVKNAIFDDFGPGFRGVPDLRPGMLVEVGGTYKPQGWFLAKELDDESGDSGRTPWPRGRITVVGRIARADQSPRRIHAMGFSFQLTDTTRLRTVIE